jgi:hypothetical protein
LEGKRVTGAESEASLTQHRPLTLPGFKVVYFNIKNSNHRGDLLNKKVGKEVLVKNKKSNIAYERRRKIIMKKILSILLTVTMVFSLVAAFRVPTASAAVDSLSGVPSSYQIIQNYPGPIVSLVQNDPTIRSVVKVGASGVDPNNILIFEMGQYISGTSTTQVGTVIICKPGDYTSPIETSNIDNYSFNLATASVKLDGIYEIYDKTPASPHTIGYVFIKYVVNVVQSTITYCANNQISGFVRHGDGSGAGGAAVVVLYPKGDKLVYAQVNTYGQFSMTVFADEKGAYTIAVVDDYPANAHNAVQVITPNAANTVDTFVYKQLMTGTMAIKLDTYVKPTFLYDDGGVNQQEVILVATDQDGDPVSNLIDPTLNVQVIVTGFGSTYSVYEIAAGYYKVIGKKSASVAQFVVKATIGGVALSSNPVNVTFKPLSDFNPVVSVDVYFQSTDTLPCTVGRTLVIKPSVFNPPSNRYIASVSATVDGPVYEIEDTTPGLAPPWLHIPTPAEFANVLTSVGDYVDPIIDDGFSGGEYWTALAPRYLITGPGTVSVTINQTTWKSIDPNGSASDPYNVCCITPEPVTFTLCTITGCDVDITKGASLTVGTPSDIEVTTTPKGMNCGCNLRVEIYGPSSHASDFFTLPNGTRTGILIYDSTNPYANPYASSNGSGVITFKGITANYCGYAWIYVYSLESVGGCATSTTSWVLANVMPNGISASIASKKLTAQVELFTGDNNYLVAGVPNNVTISGFVPGASLNYVRMDDGSGNYCNTTSTYGIVDNGDGSYLIALNPPPSVNYSGRAYPTSIKISLKKATNDGTGCTLYGSVVIPVKLPEFTASISTGCGEKITADGFLTEGFSEVFGIESAKDQRDGSSILNQITSLDFRALSSDCYIPTADVYSSGSCAGCNTLSKAVVALDNPNIDDTPTVRPQISINGVVIKLSAFNMVVTSPTIKVDPNKDIPFTTLGLPETMLIFTAIDAHSKPMCGRTFSIYDSNTMTYGWTYVGPIQVGDGNGSYIPCDIDRSGLHLPPQLLYPFALATFNATQYHTGNTLSDGTIQYPFRPNVGGRYAAIIAPDITMAHALPLQAFLKKTVLTFETTYKPVVPDTTKPVVTIDAPADGAEVSTPVIKVSGKATDNVKVVSLLVNGESVTVLPDGTFSTKVALEEGKNVIKIFASDAANNSVEQDLTVTYTVSKVTIVKIQIGSDIMTVNGKAVQIDAPAEIMNGRTFLPLRAISEALGATVDWIAETQGITVTLGKNTIGLQVGNSSAVVNGTVMTLDAAPYIKNSRTMVPFRVIAEGLGATVEWDPALRIVTVTLAQ